ncbi:MAG: error-prone DNA polymerase [Rhodospirillales bacterium]|nr:error-prone DNA polymerase [Rhodospirillales bacterium]
MTETPTNPAAAAAYAELQVTSNFSFLRGASHPEELVATAAGLGLRAIAIADRNTLAGVVRAHAVAKLAGIQLIVGARLDLDDGPSLLCYPGDRAAYGRLSRLLTLGRRRATKGECRLDLADVLAHGDGQILVALPPDGLSARGPVRPCEAEGGEAQAFHAALPILKESFGDRLYLAAHRLCLGDDDRRLAALATLSARQRIPLVATNDVHAHTAKRRPLQDVLTCIREGCTIFEAGYRLFANAERHLKPPDEMARLFRSHPQAIAAGVEIAQRCQFSLDELRYEYPVDPVANGRTPQEELVRLTWLGAAKHFPDGLGSKLEAQINHELVLIEMLDFAPYFLTVHDIVRFARERGILCQGRGSAANSAVCFCLGITAVDPSRIDVLFERFISAERNEPPDIDVDFEHERREEVIQYIYAKYGRERAGMTATVIRYRTRSALREVAKTFGLSEDAIVALQGLFWRRSWDEVDRDEMRSGGLDPDARAVRMVVDLAGELRGFPRHLSQHTGGMVITRSALSEVVPIENAAMADRTVIEWDKDDLDALGILKIDILALGMLTCVRKAFGLIETHYDRRLTLATIPAEDGRVYDMLCKADSVGVFQVESRAQMTMLPRLRPREFYDLVIEVAIVRPGPIQGDMVHPYLRRRAGGEQVEYPSEELAQVLGKTLGVPLFQEQAMKIAIVAAGFSPSEADRLRRAMATFRRSGTIHGFRDKFISGMVARGYEVDFAERCFRQIEGFADYGFPESHSASFALLVYVSAWIKCHYPAVFACALLNSQPMGFYAPAQIVGDARRHGVEVRPVDVNHSAWDCTLEPVDPPSSPGEEVHAASPSPLRERVGARAPRNGDGGKRPPAWALRLGLRQVKGLATADAGAIVAGRGPGYASMAEVWHRARVSRAALRRLAGADGFTSLGLNRRQALWAIGGLDEMPLPLLAVATAPASEPLERAREPQVRLPASPLSEQVSDDYRALTLSLKAHPMALLRCRLGEDGYLASDRLATLAHGRRVKTAGVVITRQRPGSANGVIFITLEDEAGHANLIVWPKTFERFRRIVLQATIMAVVGPIQREGEVIHVLAERLWSLDGSLTRLAADAAPGRAPDSFGDELRFDIAVRDFH